MGLDAAIIMNPQTWVTTGPMCPASRTRCWTAAPYQGARHRADKLIGEGAS